MFLFLCRFSEQTSVFAGPEPSVSCKEYRHVI